MKTFCNLSTRGGFFFRNKKQSVSHAKLTSQGGPFYYVAFIGTRITSLPHLYFAVHSFPSTPQQTKDKEL